MAAIHLTLTGKGGVGKSWITTALANYCASLEAPLYCADTDPSNPTFSAYKRFAAKHINIMTNEMNIDRSKFDELIETLVEHDGNCVVDNGSSSFLPMMAYMLENDVIPFLQGHGKTVYVHAVMVGGAGLDETLRCIDTLLKSQVARLVVWENEFFGPVVKNGKKFTDSEVYTKNKGRIAGVIRVPARSEDTYGKDLAAMSIGRLSFDEAVTSPEFRLMGRQRLTTVWRDIETQLAAIEF